MADASANVLFKINISIKDNNYYGISDGNFKMGFNNYTI